MSSSEQHTNAVVSLSQGFWFGPLPGWVFYFISLSLLLFSLVVSPPLTIFQVRKIENFSKINHQRKSPVGINNSTLYTPIYFFLLCKSQKRHLRVWSTLENLVTWRERTHGRARGRRMRTLPPRDQHWLARERRLAHNPRPPFALSHLTLKFLSLFLILFYIYSLYILLYFVCYFKILNDVRYYVNGGYVSRCLVKVSDRSIKWFLPWRLGYTILKRQYITWNYASLYTILYYIPSR